MQLLGRALPEYDFGTATTAAAHNSPDAVNSPSSFDRCIGRSDRTMLSGPDAVSSWTRCYSRLINPPSPPGSENGSGPYYVSTNPLTDPFTFISKSDGTFNDETNGVLLTKLNVFVLGQCIAVGSLHVQVVTTVNVDKTAGDTDYGSFRINVWSSNPTCTGTPNYVVGACDNLPPPAPQTVTGSCATAPDGTNFSTTPLPASSDTDGDGCTDVREVFADYSGFPPSGQGLGGLRDPFNPYDYLDINHDGSISVPVDILGVAASFGSPSNPRYIDYKDRGAPALGPFAWNKGAPNNSIDVPNDILGVATQFGHTCPHTHPAAPAAIPTTVFGAHPATLSGAVTAGATPPFAITVSNTSGFPATGQLLIDAETVTYDQTSCGAINITTQFCVTARGSGTPTGNDPAAHNANAIVFPKP